MGVFSFSSASQEVLDHIQSHKNLKYLAWILFTLMMFVIMALAFVPWQQTSTGQGRIVAYSPINRQQNIEAPIEGRIIAWHVREGSHVKAGDLMVEISDNDPEIMFRLKQEKDAVVARIDAAKARVKSIESRIVALQSSKSSGFQAAGSRAQMAYQRVQSAKQLVQAAEATYQTSELNYNRQKKLFEDGLTSQRAVELASLEWTKNRTELERAQVALNAAMSEEIALRTDQSRVSTDASASIEDAQAAKAVASSEIASGNAELARLEVRLARQHAQSVKATRDGVIVSLIANQGGEIVKAGDPLVVFVPDSKDRAVELWIPGHDMPLLHIGQEVRLQFEGWPAVQFSGWPSLAVGSFGGVIQLIDASDNGQGKFRILVTQKPGDTWPDNQYLRQGVRANGWVLMNRVRLGYELWRQFNAFPLSQPNKKESPKPGK